MVNFELNIWIGHLNLLKTIVCSSVFLRDKQISQIKLGPSLVYSGIHYLFVPRVMRVWLCKGYCRLLRACLIRSDLLFLTNLWTLWLSNISGDWQRLGFACQFVAERRRIPNTLYRRRKVFKRGHWKWSRDAEERERKHIDWDWMRRHTKVENTETLWMSDAGLVLSSSSSSFCLVRCVYVSVFGHIWLGSIVNWLAESTQYICYSAY